MTRKFWNLSPSVASKRHNAFHQEAKSSKQCFRCLHSVRDRAGTAPGPRRARRGEKKRKEERREEKRREEERRGANPPKTSLSAFGQSYRYTSNNYVIMSWSHLIFDSCGCEYCCHETAFRVEQACNRCTEQRPPKDCIL